jgi:hypothetical protein
MKQTIKKAIIIAITLTSICNISKSQTLDWKLMNTGPSRYLTNVEPALTEFYLYSNDYKRFQLKNEVTWSLNPLYPYSKNYAIFLDESMNNAFEKNPLYYHGLGMSSLISQNKIGSSFTGYNLSDNDWSQNIQSYVKRKNSASFIVRQNGTDMTYVTGYGHYVGLGFWNYSDVTLKENIETIKRALDKVKLLRGVYFNYKPKGLCDQCDTSTTTVQNDETKHMGLIAQEVETVIPEVVRNQYTGYKAVAYQNLVGLLIEAIKELDDKVNQCCAYNAKATKSSQTLGKTSSTSNTNEQMDENILMQNNPNPATAKTTIAYKIQTTAVNAEIMLFDMQGALIKKYGIKDKGEGYIDIASGELRAGIYLYSLVVDNKEIDTKRMIIAN